MFSVKSEKDERDLAVKNAKNAPETKMVLIPVFAHFSTLVLTLFEKILKKPSCRAQKVSK